MRSIVISCLCVSLASSQALGDDSLRGGLIGAAIGAIVGHNSGDIDTEWAVPAFAAAGALLGSEYNNDWYSHSSYGYDDPWYYRNPHYRHRRYHYAPRYYHHPRHRTYREPRARRHRPQPVKKKRKSIEVKPANVHPGIAVSIVSVSLANGSAIDFRILKINGRFVGPKGETYETMPAAEQLAEHHVPENLRAAVPSADDDSP
jgi:hypothetical protein